MATILKFFLIISFLLNCFHLNAQRFSTIVFDRLPADLQLYPRNNINKAQVNIKGKVEDPSIKFISVLIFRNAKQIGYLKQEIISPTYNFNFNTTINAELAEYDFAVYSFKSNLDSGLVVTRKNIVCGDAFLVTGQSNSYNGIFDKNGEKRPEVYSGEYARSFGVFNDPDNYADYNPADTLWNYSNKGNIVGMWATELQKLIIENEKIPVCVINGGSGGSSSEYNALRNAQNPTALNTTFGRLLYRTQKAGLINNIKGFFYRQGENEAYGDALNWYKNYDIIYKNFKIDIPNTRKFYVFQNNIYDFQLFQAGTLRENQRQLQTKYADVKVFSTIGTKQFDGLHYGTEGYKQTANEVFRVVQQDFYSPSNDPNIYPPNIQKAYFLNGKTELLLEFDEGQELTILETGNFSDNLKNFFMMSDGSFPITARAEKNKIYFKLNRASKANGTTFMPPFIMSNTYNFPNYNILITNKLGLRPLTFENFPIDIDLQRPIISTQKVDKLVEIKCSNVEGANTFRLEYKRANETKYELGPLLNVAQAKNFNFDLLEKIDRNYLKSSRFLIRYKAFEINGVRESDYSNEVEINYELPTPKITAARNKKPTEVELDWLFSATISSKFLVEYATDSTFKDKKALEITPTNIDNIIKNLSPGKKYFFKVRAFNDDLNYFSVFSNIVQIITKLDPPSDFLATNITDNATKLNWKYNRSFASDSTVFELEQSIDGKNFEKIKTINLADTTVLIASLKECKPYFYRISTKTDLNKSIFSTIIEFITKPTKPTNLVAINTITSLKLTWQDNSGSEKGYQVFEQESGKSDFVKIAELPSNSTELEITELKENTKLNFKVVAIGDGGASEFSNLLETSTLAITAVEEMINNSLSIYPNPVTDLIFYKSNIDIIGNNTLKIIAKSGVQIIEIKNANIFKDKTYSVDVNQLPKGIYLFQINHNNTSIVKKFLKY
jgi:Carbohydrate esterase, sialic acid-specific acetylesterase/Secretion system C-terminal sorting domain/Fibronectin type III domain